MSANQFMHYSKELPMSKHQLVLLPSMQVEERLTLAEFYGRYNALLQMTQSGMFLNLDNKLFRSQDLKTWQIVKETGDPHNIFLHLVETRDGTLFAQEYGYTTTGIYSSSNGGENWKQVVSVTKIDKHARHFHCIAYDQYRDLLIATLGDGNFIKIVTSEDYGQTWQSLYSSAYQCLPIVVTQNIIVFGMDSSLSSGLVIWHPSENKIETIHLKFVEKTITSDCMQSCDLKLLSNGVWLMLTGKGSILSSVDLINWHVLLFGEKEQFELNQISNENDGLTSVTLGSETVVLELDALKAPNQRIHVKKYPGLFPRIKGLGYIAKRMLKHGI
jgi:hypothetical protein